MERTLDTVGLALIVAMIAGPLAMGAARTGGDRTDPAAIAPAPAQQRAGPPQQGTSPRTTEGSNPQSTDPAGQATP